MFEFTVNPNWLQLWVDLIPVAGVRGQGGWTSRGGGVGTVILPNQDFAREIQIFKKIFGLRPKPKMIRGDLYLVMAASRPRAVLSSANSAKPTARGVPVTSPLGYRYASI